LVSVWIGVIEVAGATPELGTGVVAFFRGTQRHGFAALWTDGRSGASRLTTALGNAFCGELFAVAAALNELFFQGFQLTVKEIIGLVDEADQGIGDDGGVGGFEPPGVEGGMGDGIGRIGPIG